MINHSEDDIKPMRLAWLPGIAAGTLCALLVWPQTHRLVATQLRLVIPTPYSIAAGSPIGYTDPQIAAFAAPIVRNTASQHPADVSMQMAAATSVPPDSGQLSADLKIRRLNELVPQFSNDPSLYATIIRYSTQGKVRVTRREAQLFLKPAPARNSETANSKVHSSPADVEQYDALCLTGERLDPDNAYFPLMRSIGLFESHHDAEALASLDRAAACSGWAEYYDVEYSGEVQLQQEAFGPSGPLPKTGFGAAILLPHLASIKSAALLALEEAVKAEQAGRPLDGLRIRASVRRIGALMRSESRTFIGNLVGIRLENLSLMRPGGSPPPAANGFDNDKAARERLVAAYCDYLVSVGRPEDRENVRAEVDGCVKTREIMSAGLSQSVFDTGLTDVIGVSVVDMIVLSIVVWMLALAAFTTLMLAVSATKPVKRMSVLARGLLMTFLIIGGGSVVTALMVYQTVHSVGTVANLGRIWLNPDGGDSGHRALQILCDGILGIVATLPVLTLVTLAVLCRVWRAPIAAGVARGLRGSVLPICSLLVIGYSVMVPITSAKENSLEGAVFGTIQHEGRNTARLLGRDWPGLVRP